MPLTGSAFASSRRAITELLAEARARTLLLVSPLSEEAMQRRPQLGVDSVLDQLERIVAFEQSLLLDERPVSVDSYDAWFDQMMDVRQRVLDRLDRAEPGQDPLRTYDRYRLVVEHEYQRNEAALQAVQCQAEPYRAPHQRVLPPGRGLGDPGFMVRFAGGVVEIGQAPHQPGWPEERPLHLVEVEPFWIDVMPVTNADYMTFVAAHGYQQRELWSPEGWAWAQDSGAAMPANWSYHGGEWLSRWLGQEAPLDPDCPVCLVTQFEAEAFAGFIGKRLPTEHEWETAAAWDPETQQRRSFPWGNMSPSPHVANLDHLAFGPAPVGAFPGNISPLGCYGLVGDAWEWTSSPFEPYPGSTLSETAVPSEAKDLLAAANDLVTTEFDPAKRVLRGGSWATRPGAIRNSVRRAAMPNDRHLFAGFRCAR
jgi:gamma-glutamyl hercynylcysteine S-oxide synthase